MWKTPQARWFTRLSAHCIGCYICLWRHHPLKYNVIDFFNRTLSVFSLFEWNIRRSFQYYTYRILNIFRNIIIPKSVFLKISINKNVNVRLIKIAILLRFFNECFEILIAFECTFSKKNEIFMLSWHQGSLTNEPLHLYVPHQRCWF